MITAKISAGSSSIVQDIINMCQSIHSPIGDWQGFVYNSTTGSKPWCVWAARMDEDAHELQYVSSSGLAAPPDAYELITVSAPTTTGFTLSFTTVNSMPSVLQTRDASSGGAPSISANGNIVTIKMSAAATNAVADLVTIYTNIAPSGGGTYKVFYNSSAGNKPWAAYVVHNTYGQTNIGGVLFVYTIGGMASPPAGSEQLAITCPSATLTTDGFTQIGGPLSISAR